MITIDGGVGGNGGNRYRTNTTDNTIRMARTQPTKMNGDSAISGIDQNIQ